MADTIFALSSAAGRAGVAVVRVSGPQAGVALVALCRAALPAPRQARLATLCDPAGEVIDRALVLWFAGPASFTGEDVAEFHVHGGRAVLEALFDALAGLGLRAAEPGEFTRRAVENGKFDLTAAEGLIDLIDAETQGQRRQALRQQAGALGELYEGWRAALLRHLAWAEAAIDFADEELPDGVEAAARAGVALIASEMQAHLADAQRGELVRDGVSIAVIGPPNAGKSSLVNVLAKRDVAIVAASAGTTRDVVEVRLDLGGYAVTLADTAGLREAAEAVEAEGIRRALTRAEAADLVLLVVDASAPDPLAGVPDEIAAGAALVIRNKSDLIEAMDPREARELCISTRTGEGVAALLQRLTALVRARLEQGGEAPVLTRARHRAAVEEALAALTRSLHAPEAELMAEDLRLATRALGRITGRVDVEELLDVIFRDFCIGK